VTVRERERERERDWAREVSKGYNPVQSVISIIFYVSWKVYNHVELS